MHIRHRWMVTIYLPNGRLYDAGGFVRREDANSHGSNLAKLTGYPVVVSFDSGEKQ